MPDPLIPESIIPETDEDPANPPVQAPDPLAQGSQLQEPAKLTLAVVSRKADPQKSFEIQFTTEILYQGETKNSFKRDCERSLKNYRAFASPDALVKTRTNECQYNRSPTGLAKKDGCERFHSTFSP
jgi:hypothetical protein